MRLHVVVVAETIIDWALLVTISWKKKTSQKISKHQDLVVELVCLLKTLISHPIEALAATYTAADWVGLLGIAKKIDTLTKKPSYMINSHLKKSTIHLNLVELIQW